MRCCVDTSRPVPRRGHSRAPSGWCRSPQSCTSIATPGSPNPRRRAAAGSGRPAAAHPLVLTEPDLELPRRLRHAFGGRFAAAVVLGSGPHGTVLRARDSAYGEVAVKLLTAHAPDVA